MQLRFSAKFIILSLVSMILLLSSQRHAQAQSEPIACGETVSGEITDDKAQDYWWFAGQAGQTVTISMWGDVDSALLLADTGGYVLARSTGIGDAYLEQTITETATYTIEATRRGGESSDSVGAYELLLECAAPVSQAGATVTTETELAAAIRAANQDAEADVISLGADITLTAELPTISSSITILGNEHSISGNERVRIFFVTESGALSLRDAIFRDGAAREGGSLCDDSDRIGGAICNLGSLEVSDSVFSGNFAEDGGAIVNFGEASVRISNSDFSGNAAENGGAIINYYGGGSISISDSVFSDNSGMAGGAIYNFGELSISNSEFSGNSAVSGGGAIFNVGGSSISISDSIFSGNSAVEQGGAIVNRSESSISISNSVFSDNNSAVEQGGAIVNYGELSISDSEFRDNSAGELGLGGAIWNNDDGEVSISNSVFSDNSPQDCHGVGCRSAPDGGASGQVGVSASENDDLASQAGATVTTETELAAAIRAANQNAEADVISLGADITLTEELPRISSSITILGNEHSISGNERVRIFFVTESGALTLRDAIFRDGAATEGNSLCFDPEIFGLDTGEEVAPESRTGGAICNHGSLEVSGSVFSGNSAELGGAIVNLGEASISGSVFSGNSAELGGGAIVHLDLTLMLSISDNLTEEVGDAIVNFGEASISISDSEFSGNSADAGGAIVNSGSISISGSDFSGNSADAGGAIANSGSISISGSDFSGNSADFNGGAIATQGELSISDSEFRDNSAGELGLGGAIWNNDDGEVSISNSVFSDNSPQDCHGVVCRSAPDGGASGQVGVSASENDDLASQAGATVTTETELAAAIRAANQNAEADVISLGADITLTEELPRISSSITILGNEHSISGNERVRIFFVTESGALTLRDAILRDGAADGATTGGNSLCFDLEIFGLDTGEEVAPEFGGAICNHGSLEVSDSVFSGNSADAGGAIFNLGEASISDSVFSNNTAEASGGAIVNLDIILMLSTSVIPTEVVGDAIVNFGEASISISESNFSDNKAYAGGAIYNLGEVSISDSNFSSNSAEFGGGAIWNNDDGEVSISSSVFSDNSPQDCLGVVCRSVPDGGPSGQVGVAASASDELASPSPSRISYGESATDSLSDSRAYIDFPFQAQAGDNVLISMDATGGDLDPLLKLYDDAGNELANDDDSGDGNNALIEFRIPSAGEFVINAGRYAGSGDFRVSLSLAETRAAQVPQAGASEAPSIPGDASGSPPAIVLAHEKLLSVENVACSASDSYFILRLKTDSVLNQHILEINLNTRGDARIAQVVPLPEADSYGEDVNWVDFSELVEAGVQQVSSFLIEAGAEYALGAAGGPTIKVLEFGSDIQRWVDERYTRGQSPAGLRLTWYNTGVDPAVARYLVHVTHSSDGSLGLSTSLARLTIFAEAAAAAHNEMKPSYEGDYLAEAFNFFSGKTTANATKDLLKPLIPEDLQYLIDFSPAAVMAYFTERVAINRDAMEISQPVAIC